MPTIDKYTQDNGRLDERSYMECGNELVRWVFSKFHVFDVLIFVSECRFTRWEDVYLWENEFVNTIEVVHIIHFELFAGMLLDRFGRQWGDDVIMIVSCDVIGSIS